MKKILIMVLSAIVAMSLNSCTIRTQVVTSDDEDYVNCYSEPRSIDSLTAICNYSPCTVIFKVDTVTSITVEGNESDVKVLSTVMDKGKLKVNLKPGTYKNFKARVIVTAPTANDFLVQGSGSIICNDPVICNDVCSLCTEGSGDITMKSIVCRKADICTSGSGEVNITSQTQAAEAWATVNGSGSINMGGVYVASIMYMTINGSGDITADGETMDVNATINGSGSISGVLKHDSISEHRNGSGSINLKKKAE